MEAGHDSAPALDADSLADRAILVTGAAGGIGRAVVEQLRRQRAAVIATDRPGTTLPEAVLAIPCDLADAADTARLLDSLSREGVEPYGFVHAGGVTRDSLVSKISDEHWRLVLRINLEAAFQIVRDLSPGMRERGTGSIVLIASINGERGKAGQANYCASKAGLIGFMKSCAHELGRYGVRANAVAPGWIDTPMTAVLDERFRKRAIDESALRRVGCPEDVAHAATFLLGERARHITGQVLRVDGGQLTA